MSLEQAFEVAHRPPLGALAPRPATSPERPGASLQDIRTFVVAREGEDATWGMGERVSDRGLQVLMGSVPFFGWAQKLSSNRNMGKLAFDGVFSAGQVAGMDQKYRKATWGAARQCCVCMENCSPSWEQRLQLQEKPSALQNFSPRRLCFTAHVLPPGLNWNRNTHRWSSHPSTRPIQLPHSAPFRSPFGACLGHGQPQHGLGEALVPWLEDARQAAQI